jgi:hypothetical protein
MKVQIQRFNLRHMKHNSDCVGRSSKDYRLENRRSFPWTDLRFLYTTASRSARVSKQFPIQLLGGTSQEEKAAEA